MDDLEEYMEWYSRKKMVTLSDSKRKEFVHECILLQKNNKLPRGTIKVLQEKYNISERTARLFWGKIKKSLGQGSTDIDLSSSKKNRSGRKKRDRDELVAAIAKIEFNERCTLRSLQISLESRGFKVGLATLSRMYKENLF